MRRGKLVHTPGFLTGESQNLCFQKEKNFKMVSRIFYVNILKGYLT